MNDMIVLLNTYFIMDTITMVKNNVMNIVKMLSRDVVK